MKFDPNAFEILQERGFFHTISHEKELKGALGKGPITFYLGFDPTADDLHIGNVFALQAFKILQDCGHRGIILLGGATAQIGDPSYKNDMRKLMETSDVDSNVSAIKKVLSRFIDVSITEFVNNADWTRQRGYIEFMREVGTHFNVARMLANECYKVRMQAGGLTFFEMGYMLIQAHDFIHLNDKYGCTLQIGGSDQWGNILAGVELSRKMALKSGEPRPPMFAFCYPLLTTADGKKMGKTEKGALWINQSKTSVYDVFQYFMNVADEDVERLLRYFTLIPINKIKSMCTDIVGAKKSMAFEITKKIHGEQAAAEAQNMAQQLFSGSGSDAPSETIKTHTRQLVDILALTSIIKSKREARELLESGAIQIDGERVTDINATIKKDDFLVKKGKKTFLRVVIS